MSQPYGKTGSTSGWPHNFLHSLTSFDFSQLNVYAGIRAGVLITSLLIIGVFSNHIREATLAALGTIFFLQGRTKQTLGIRTLVLASVINASAFAIGSIIGTTYLAVPLLAVGLFIISYLGVYPNTAVIVVISAVVFSVGVALPVINNISPGERFWLFLVGGLWGVLGAITSLGWQFLTKKSPAIEVVKPPVQVHLRSNQGIFDPLRSNMSLESGHFQFAVSFAVIGAIGLLIAQGLGLMKGYWVLITVCVLLLRSDILVTFSFTAMLIIGTIGGAVIGSIIIANVYSTWLLVSMFAFTSIFYAVKNVNYALASLFLTPFILVFLNILIPGQTLLAQTRILDTIIGAALSLLGVFSIWAFSYLKR
jgi:Fusaric acid resistance protein-like